MEKIGDKEKWYENGCNLYIQLPKEDLERLMSAPELRKWM
jgi:hypothetical protein